jgi:hypothetical protein
MESKYSNFNLWRKKVNVELTIQEMFDNYPTLFKERADCLNHLFCVIGNGYKWVNGELVLISNKPTKEYIDSLACKLINGKAYQYNKLSLRAESQYYEKERIAEGWYEEYHDRYPDENIDRLKAIRQNTINKLPDDVYYKEPIRKKRWGFYVNIPGHEEIDFHENFAKLFNFPDNIKPDWKEAIEECRQLLIEDGFELP